MNTYRILPGVKLGKNARIGDFVIIGVPPVGAHKGELETIIGDNALLRSHTVIYAGNVIGRDFQTGHGAMIRESNRIGDRVSVGAGSVIEHDVEIGHDVRVHSQAFVPEFSTLEDGCWIGPNATLTNALHPLCPKVKDCLKGPTIRRGAKVGANATILPGLVVGEDALVGAGAVVVKDVPAAKVVVGNPATPVGDVFELDCPHNLLQGPYRPGQDR